NLEWYSETPHSCLVKAPELLPDVHARPVWEGKQQKTLSLSLSLSLCFSLSIFFPLYVLKATSFMHKKNWGVNGSLWPQGRGLFVLFILFVFLLFFLFFLLS